MGNSRSFQPPSSSSSNNSLPNIKIGNANTDSSISTSTTTYDEDKTDTSGYRQSISSLPVSSKKPSIRHTDLKSPKGSISFTQGLTNNANNNHNHHHHQTSKNKLPPLTTNKQNSLSTPPSLDTLSTDYQSNNKLGIRQVISNDSFQTISSSTYSSSLTNTNPSNNNTLRVNETATTSNRVASPIQFGRRTSSTQALNSLAKSPTKAAGAANPTSPKNNAQQQQPPSSLSNNNNNQNIKNRSNDSPASPLQNNNNNKSPPFTASSTSTITNNNNSPLITSSMNCDQNNNGPNSSYSLLGPLPILNNPRTADTYESEDEPSTLVPNKLISTNSFSLISSHKRVGAKLMFDRDSVNNSNVNKLDDCDTGSEISRQEDEQPLILSSNLDVIMRQGKVTSPTRAKTSLAAMESPEVMFDTPPKRKTSLKNIASAPTLLYDSLSRKSNEKGNSLTDSLTLDKPISSDHSPSDEKKSSNRMRRSVGESDDILDDILSEKPTLKSLKKLKSENSVRRRAGSLNNSKVVKKGVLEKNSSYLRENDGISSNIMDILKGCEDLLGDLELEPKCSCAIEITQPDTNPETAHLLPLQNSRRFNLLTVPDLKQVMRESRSEQKQHEKKQKNVNKDVANIIKDIRSSFSEFDF